MKRFVLFVAVGSIMLAACGGKSKGGGGAVASTPSITTTSFPDQYGPAPGAADAAYTSQSVTASGGITPHTYTATGLPPGLTMNTSGVISGRTTANGTYAPTVIVKDGAGASASKTVSITLVPGISVTTTPATGFGGDVGKPYSLVYTASGGAGSITWVVDAGTSLPPGVTAGSLTGTTLTLSGTPTKAGSYNVAVTATDTGLNQGTANKTHFSAGSSLTIVIK